MTRDISGLPGSGSLRSVALQWLLESRLRARMDGLGSTLYSLTWNGQDTPAGRRICQLRASAPRTSDNDCTGWPSPVVNDAKGSDYTYAQGNAATLSLKLGGAAKLSGWATAAAAEPGGKLERYLERKRAARARGSQLGISVTNLSMQAQLARLAVSGPPPTGSTVETPCTGQLNPEHSRWLMGYPEGWQRAFEATVTQSSRSSRRRSSER